MFVFKRREASAEITPDALQRRLTQGERVFVLDVREPDEYQAAHIPDSVLVPLGQLATRFNEIPRDCPIIAVCRTGNRSGVATTMLRRAGFDAVNLAGGMVQWQKHGLPVERTS